MSINITKQYYWKVLTSDGLLKDPDPNRFRGYSSVNDTAPFVSEVEAVIAIEKYYEDSDWISKGFVLHCEYALQTEY